MKYFSPILSAALLFASFARLSAADAQLDLSGERKTKATAVRLQPATKENITVYQAEGRYGGWPANHGLWQWGDELVVGFTSTWYKHQDHDHAIDRTKPSYEWQARSLDGGRTWKVESELPFADPKSEAKPTPLTEPLDFTAPDFALMFRFGSLHVGPSWFYASTDRCKTWRGPFKFDVQGIDKICTRTDLIVLGPRDCLMFGSAGKADSKEGRIFCARTTDGGLHWKLVARIGEEPTGYAIMPSSVRLKSGAIITTVRRYDAGKRGFIEAWRSDDLGEHWTSLGQAAPEIGGGNPPALVQLHDGRLALTYGYRAKPYGARARISSDEGRTWSTEIILREDGLTGDLGYPRSIVRPDGKVLTIYYFNGPRDEDRTIQGTLWTPPALSAEAKRETITNSIGMKLVRIEPGTFTMGQDGPTTDYRSTKHPAEFDRGDWDEKPAHKVTLTKPFHMATTEVTLGQYRHFDADFRKDDRNADSALNGISWAQAVKFCAWLSAKEGRTYRLPTEAEWEYACRAGTSTLFHTGDTLPAEFQPWLGNDGRRQLYFGDAAMPPEYRLVKSRPTLQVAQTAANAWGLFDMHGNVAEWCADWYGPYEAAAQTDPLGRSDGDFRIFRGGWHSSFTRLIRSANRGAWLPDSVSSTIGFRVVLGEPPKGTLLPPAAPPLNAQHVSQALPTIAASPADVPFFSGPKVFLKIPPDSTGPLFSWHNHSPAITECPNGDLLAVWFSCADEGGSELCNLASRLRFGTTEWEDASPFWDGADVNDHAPKLWWDGERTIYHFARGLTENIVRTSTDSGATWSKARAIFPHGEFGNQLLRTREGYLILPHDSRTVSLVSSRDGGKSWSAIEMEKRDTDMKPGGTGHRPPGIHAPIVQLTDGRLMAFSRQDPPEDQARFDGKTPASFSSDFGKTWTFEKTEFPAISSAQRAVMIRLREGPLLLCSYTDVGKDWKTKHKGLPFKAADGSEFTGYGLFAAVSFDEGKTWSNRRLITPGGKPRDLPTIDRGIATFSDTLAEPTGYLSITQTRDGRIQLLSSKNHYVFNLAWLKQLPPAPKD